MKFIKNLAIFGIGAGMGFGYGAAFVTEKLLSCEETREALIRVLSDKIDAVLFGERTGRRNGRTTYWQH